MSLAIPSHAVLPTTIDEARAIPIAERWALEERLGEAADVVSKSIDADLRDWAADGWTQKRMADEIGCSTQAVNKRLRRLEVKTESRRGRPRSTSNINPVDIPADVVEDAEWSDVEEAQPAPSRRGIAPPGHGTPKAALEGAAVYRRLETFIGGTAGALTSFESARIGLLSDAVDSDTIKKLARDVKGLASSLGLLAKRLEEVVDVA